MLFYLQHVCSDFSGLPQTSLGRLVEKRVNTFLKQENSGAGYVTVRVVSSVDRAVEVKAGMKMRCVNDLLL